MANHPTPTPSTPTSTSPPPQHTSLTLSTRIVLQRSYLQSIEYQPRRIYIMIFQAPFVKKVDNYAYSSNDIVGQGSSSTVYLGSSILNNERVAIRVVNLKSLVPETLLALQNEMVVLKHLPLHPNTLQIHKILQTENHVYFVTEYCESQPVITNTQEMNQVATGIIEGLKHLAKHNVIHRDIKPQNIMMKKGVPKLIDFGFAKVMNGPQEVMMEHLGTPYYMSPQILEKKPYTSKCDIWSLGATLYELRYKSPPFNAYTLDELTRRAKSRMTEFKPEYNDALETIIKGCLMPEESQRLTWEQLFSLATQLSASTYPKENPNGIYLAPLKPQTPFKTPLKRLSLGDMTNQQFQPYF